MRTRNTITKLFAITMAVAAIAVIGSTFTTRAQQVRAFRGTTIVGFIPQQTLRFNAANLTKAGEGGGPVRVQVRLFDSQGNVIARIREVEIPAGQFRSFDFSPDDLAAAGEPSTGRLEVGADFQFQADASVSYILPKHLTVTMEVMDSHSGGSYYTGTITVSGDP